MAPSAVAEAAAGADVGANGRGGGGGGVRRAAAHKRERAAQPPAATGAVYEVVVGGERRRAVWDAHAARARLVPARSAAGEASSGAEGADGGGAAAAWRAVQRAFLPANVTSDYWEYARWRCCQRVASSMLNVLATQQMLYAIGIGAERGLAAAAVVNWVLKDGLGRLGKLAVSTRLGSSFDADLKQYRFSSSVVYNVAHALEFTTALVPQHFLVLATVANIGKSIGVSTSMSITPAIHRSFAMSENMADVSAKNQAQQVVADNVGLALAVGLSKWWAHVSPSKAAVTLMPFAAYPVLAGLDMFCIRNELRAVALRTLNVTRAELAADEWLRRGGGAGGGGAAGGAHTRGAVGGDRGSGGRMWRWLSGGGDGGGGGGKRKLSSVPVAAPTAREVALVEPVMPGRRPGERVLRLSVGALPVAHMRFEAELRAVAEDARDCGSALVAHVDPRTGERTASLVLGEGAVSSAHAVLRGVLEAAHLRRALGEQDAAGKRVSGHEAAMDNMRRLQKESKLFADKHTSELMEALVAAGWNTTHFKLSETQASYVTCA